MENSFKYYRSVVGDCIPDQELFQLIELANSGDTHAMDRIIKSFIPHAINIAIKVSRQHRDLKDDMLCEAIIAVPKIVKEYDRSKGVAFHSFCVMKMAWAAMDVARLHKRKKPQNSSVVEWSEVADSLAFVRDCHIDAVLTSLFVAEVVDALPSQQASVIKSYYGIGCEPKPVVEIAREMGMSSSWVNLTKHRALKLMRERLEGRRA